MAKKRSVKSTAEVISDQIRGIDGRRRSALVDGAIEKLENDEELTVRERVAVANWERIQTDQWGAVFAANCPKKRYSDEVGIQQPVLLSQSRRFDLAYHTSGKTVDLFAQVRSWHQWATKHKHGLTRMFQAERLAGVLSDDADGSFDYWNRELIKEKTLKEKDGRLHREGTMLPRELFHDFLQEFYIEPMRRRIDNLDKRDDDGCAELADSLRDDIHTFEEGLLLIFADHEEEQIPKIKKKRKPTKGRNTSVSVS